jgi:nicotinamidase-related amidase
MLPYPIWAAKQMFDLASRGAPPTMGLAVLRKPCRPRIWTWRLRARSNQNEEKQMPTATPVPGKTLLDPRNHTLIMIDHQSQMAFATKSIDAVSLRNNAGLVARAAADFNVSTILTTVAEKTFSGPIFTEIKNAFPAVEVVDRTTMNTWEDSRITGLVNGMNKEKIVLAGLWTSVCIVGPALSALDQGYEVYVISDACGDVSDEAHERAMERMIQPGARPRHPCSTCSSCNATGHGATRTIRRSRTRSNVAAPMVSD